MYIHNGQDRFHPISPSIPVPGTTPAPRPDRCVNELTGGLGLHRRQRRDRLPRPPTGKAQVAVRGWPRRARRRQPRTSGRASFRFSTPSLSCHFPKAGRLLLLLLLPPRVCWMLPHPSSTHDTNPTPDRGFSAGPSEQLATTEGRPTRQRQEARQAWMILGFAKVGCVCGWRVVRVSSLPPPSRILCARLVF